MYLWSVRIRDYVLNITQNDRRLALISFQSVLNELIILLDMLIRMAPSVWLVILQRNYYLTDFVLTRSLLNHLSFFY